MLAWNLNFLFDFIINAERGHIASAICPLFLFYTKQQECLLNTKKIGKTWLVSGPECRAYWNIPDPYINESKVNREY